MTSDRNLGRMRRWIVNSAFAAKWNRRSGWWTLCRHVVTYHFELCVFDPVQPRCVDVSCEDPPRRTNPIDEPGGEAWTTGANLPDLPTSRESTFTHVAERRWIEELCKRQGERRFQCPGCLTDISRDRSRSDTIVLRANIRSSKWTHRRATLRLQQIISRQESN